MLISRKEYSSSVLTTMLKPMMEKICLLTETTLTFAKSLPILKKLQDFDKNFAKIENLVRTFDRDFNAKIAMPLEKLFRDNMPESISEPLYSIWNDKLDDLKKAMTTYEYEIPEIYPKVKIVIDDELTGFNPD